MNYQETVDFIFSQLPAYHRIGMAAYKGDLNTSLALDEYFGHPHRKYRTIHIGGTNGKGSVSHMMASVLQEAGYKTGLYTSPHLRDFRERIKINGEMIAKEDVMDFVMQHGDIFGKLKPSFFEMTVAMAFDHFFRQEVDVAVIEVGLGGRLDSTNIIKPILSVITNIGHDHMDLLGNSLEKVAAEKAGIIKEAVPVVVSETQPQVRHVFISRARETDSPLSFADERFICDLGAYNSEREARIFSVTDINTMLRYDGETSLCGDYQAFNIQAVFGAMPFLQDQLGVAATDMLSGIGKVTDNTGFAGRWQVLGREPLVICDTAHNREGLEYVLRQINRIIKSGLHFILGFVSDKDLDSILPLFPRDAVYYFTRASVPRAMDEKELEKKASTYGLRGAYYPDVQKAYAAAMKNAGRSDLIFIGGSTFVVAEVL
jgi:dihydrofolate synthase/folylpolyglutamate synthase